MICSENHIFSLKNQEIHYIFDNIPLEWPHNACQFVVRDAQRLIDNGCTLVAEGANMPCSAEAIRCLQGAGVLFGPCKAANAGAFRARSCSNSTSTSAPVRPPVTAVCPFRVYP